MKILGTAQSGAIFSDCMKYRFRLWRSWNPELPRVCFILLNPSTADEIENDPTIERQYRRVVSWAVRGLLPEVDLSSRRYPKGFGRIDIVNACAFRSTDPKALFRVDDPVGDLNGENILLAATEAVASGGLVICGWGIHLSQIIVGQQTLHNRLVEFLHTSRISLAAFKLNKDGTPVHPLYLGYHLKPHRWEGGQLFEEVV